MSSGSSETSNRHEPFLIKCPHCRWQSKTTGLSDDLKSFKEVKGSCSKCGKPRTFVCPSCRRLAVMRRVI